MAKTVRFFNNISLPGGDTVELLDMLGGIKYLLSGEVQQITIRKVSGADTTVDIQIRYISGNSDLDKLVYFYDSATINSTGFVDSSISAPFSCSTKTINSDGDLHLALENTGGSCVVSIRVDFDINNYKGV